MKHRTAALAVLILLIAFAHQAGAWHDKTHLAVCRAAGHDLWFNCAAPDIAKLKAHSREAYNHWFNNIAEVEVTPRMVLEQVERYNKANRRIDSEGHLPGAIIGALRAYKKDLQRGKYALYHLVYCGHYIGDLTMPLHMIAYDGFNKKHHLANDGIVEETILDEPEKITQYMYEIRLGDDSFEDDLAREIARIANLTRKLGYKLREENRVMTQQEACVQLGHSASLFQAVLRHYKKPAPPPDIQAEK